MVESILNVRSKNKPRNKPITKSKVIPRKVFLQYEGKKIKDKKTYFVVNELVTIIIDFE